MYIKKNKNVLNNLYMYIVGILLTVYIFFDFINSENIGLKNPDRTIVYVFLIIILITLAVYIIVIWNKKIEFRPISNTLFLLTIWIFTVNILNIQKDASIWNACIHLGLSMWWFLIYQYIYINASKFPERIDLIISFITLVFIFYLGATVYASYNIKQIYSKENSVVNIVYYVISSLPITLLKFKDKKGKLLILFALIVTMLSMKRGAIISIFVMVIGMILTEAMINNNFIKSILKLIVVGSVFAVLIVVFDNFSDGFLSSRFTIEQLADGSGRIDLYKLAIDEIANRNIIDIMIGKGSGSSIKCIGTGVHNEWLEFLFSFGIIGILLYLKLIINMIKTYLIHLKNRSKYAPYCCMAMIYPILVGMFGGIYFVHSTLYVFIFFAVLDGITQNGKKRGVIYEKSRDIDL